MQTKLDQPPWKNGQHQTPETRPQLQTLRKKRSWTLQETMAIRRCRNRSKDLSHGGRWWYSLGRAVSYCYENRTFVTEFSSESTSDGPICCTQVRPPCYILHVLSIAREMARSYDGGRGGRCNGEQRRDSVWLQGRDLNKNTVLYLLVSILLQPRDAVGWSLETLLQIFLCHNIHHSVEGFLNVKKNNTPTGQTLENNEGWKIWGLQTTSGDGRRGDWRELSDMSLHFVIYPVKLQHR